MSSPEEQQLTPKQKQQQLQQHLRQQCDVSVANLLNFGMSPDSTRLPKHDYLQQMQQIISGSTESIQNTLHNVVKYLLALDPESVSNPVETSTDVDMNSQEEHPSSAATVVSQGTQAIKQEDKVIEISDTEEKPDVTALKKLKFKRPLHSSGNSLPRKHAKIGNHGRVHNQTERYFSEVSELGIWCPITTTCTEVMNDTNLEKHLLEVHNLLPFRCLARGCFASFSNWQQLLMHSKTHGKWLPCGKCSLKFQEVRSLVIHDDRHHQAGKFACSYQDCDFQSTINRDAVVTHYLKRHPELLRRCPHEGCPFKVKRVETLERHVRCHHTGRFSCMYPKCQFSCKEEGAVIHHGRTIHFPQLTKGRGNREARKWVVETI